MRAAFVTFVSVAALGLAACQPAEDSRQGSGPGGEDSRKPVEPWVKAPALGAAASPVRVDFELAKAPQTGDFAAVRLRWQASQPQAATRWKVQTQGALERGAAPAELAVPALAAGQPYETTLQLRAVSSGFGEVHLHPAAAGAAGGWAIPVWVAPRP
jgi:hypothetical protein